MAYGPHELLPRIKDVFIGVDLILHGGDVNSVFVLDELETIAPVLAAAGNSDLALRDSRVKDKHILSLEGFVLWLCHVFPFPDLYHYLEAIRRTSGEQDKSFDTLLDKVTKDNPSAPDIIIFGHTHKVLLYQHHRLLLINPGSPVFPNQRQMPGTVATLSLSPGKVETEFIQL